MRAGGQLIQFSGGRAGIDGCFGAAAGGFQVGGLARRPEQEEKRYHKDYLRLQRLLPLLHHLFGQLGKPLVRLNHRYNHCHYFRQSLG